MIDVDHFDDANLDYAIGYAFVNERKVFEFNVDQSPIDDGHTALRRAKAMARVKWREFDAEDVDE